MDTLLVLASSRKFAGMDNELIIPSPHGGSEHSANFTVDFPSVLELRGIEHEIALIRAELSYSFTNVDAAFYNNHKFKYYSPESEEWIEVTIPNGNYNFQQLSNYVTAVVKANEGLSGDDPAPFEIVPNYPILKVEIVINTEGYKVDLTEGNFRKLLGFDAKIVEETEYGSSNGNITNDVDALLIRLSGVKSFLNGDASDVVYTFTPSVPVGAAMSLEPNCPIYVPFRDRDIIKTLHVYITDQLGRQINLNNEGTVYTFHIRPRRK